MAPPSEGNGSLASCHTPTGQAKKRLGTLSGERFATLGDLELALQAAIHVNQHLNREIEGVLQRLRKTEEERNSWQQRAQQLAKQLAKERRLRAPSGDGEEDLIPAGSAAADAGAGSPKQRRGGQLSDDQGSLEDDKVAANLLRSAGAAAAAGSGQPGSPGGVLGWAKAGGLLQSEKVAEPLQQLLSKGKAAGWLATQNDVKLGGILGQGAFGTTYRAVWRGADVAVKCVKITSPSELLNFLREVECLAALRHPHVVPFLGACLQDQSSCWLISEFMPRGTLSQWVHQHSGPLGPQPPLVDRLTRGLEVASALAALEACQPPILHRDVKPTNVFLDGSGCARLGDFGLARQLPSSRATLTGETGTYLYMSPEMIRHEVYDTKTDVWSFGVTLAELITGVQPYQETYMTPVQIAMGVADEKLQPWLPNNLPPSLLALAHACCDFDPELRPTFQLVVSELTGVIQEMKEQQQQQQQHQGGGLLGKLMNQGSLPQSWVSVLGNLGGGS